MAARREHCGEHGRDWSGGFNVALTVGVLADTHIPDRQRDLPPAVLNVFRSAGVTAILHAGDVIHPRVLIALEAIAPTYAVRGNRDIYFLHRLPLRRILTFAGVTVGMIHTHGTLWQYLTDKWEHLRRGVPFRRFEQRALAAFPEAGVVLFGHTHYPVCRWAGQQLLCNPGSPVRPIFRHLPPTVALLHFSTEGKVSGEMVFLTD